MSRLHLAKKATWPTVANRKSPLRDRFCVKVRQGENGCWEWAAINAPALVRRPEPITPPAAPDKTAAKKTLRVPAGKPGDIVHPVDGDGTVITSITVTHREPRFVIDLEDGAS